MSTSLGRLVLDLAANTAGFERDMQRVSRSTQREMAKVNRDLAQAERQSQRATQAIGRLGLQIAAVSAVGIAVLAREFASLAQQADRLDKLSRATGVTAEELQRLGFAAEQSGSDLETVAKSVTQLQRNIQNASDGLATYNRAFERIGVSVKDLQGLSPDQQFLQIAQALSQVEDAGVRNATALELFGRAGRDLLPMLAEGADGIRELGDQFERTGAMISDQATEDFARFNDAVNVLRKNAQAFRVSIFEDMIGPLADFVEFLGTERGTQVMREALENLRAAAIALGTILAGRFLIQLAAATQAFIAAQIQIARLTAAKLALQGASVGATRAVVGLRLAVSTLLGPVGIAVAAIATIAPAVLSMRREIQAAGPNIDRFRQKLDETRQSMDRFSNAHIRMLNQMQEMPGSVAELRAELEKAEAELRRFTRQYGENSVAARSAADRVALITEQLALFGVEVGQAEVGTRNLAKAIGEHLRDAVKAAEKAWEAAQRDGDNFMEMVDDLAAALEGRLAVAVRQHNQDIEEMNRLLAVNAISAEDAAKASGVFAARLEQEFKKAANSVIELQKRMMELFMFGGGGASAGSATSAAQLASSLSLAISGSQGQSLGESIGGAIKTFGMGGIQEGLQDALTTAFENLELDDAQMQVAFLAIGEAIGGNIGAALGTAIGATIGAILGQGSPIGMQIGAMIGNAVGSLFDRQKDPILQSAGRFGFSRDPEEARRRGDFVETDLGEMFFRFRNVSEEAAGTLKRALRQFDGVMADIIGEEFIAQASALLDGFRSDSQDMGTIIQQRFDLIVSVVDGFAREIALAGSTLEEQMQNLMDVFRLRNLAAIGDDMGFADADDPILLASQLARAGETIGQAFDRLLTAVGGLDVAMALTGATIDGGRAGVVRFGDALVKAFGDDLNRAMSGLNRIFDEFFSDEERYQQQADAARHRATELFAALGVDISDALFTEGGFRELFDDLFGTLTPEQTAQLIEAGVAIADLIDAEQLLAGARGESVGAAQRDAQAITDLFDQVDFDAARAGLTGLDAALFDLNARFDDMQDSLIAAGATQEELAQLADARAAAEGRLLAAEQARLDAQEAATASGLLQREMQLLGDTAGLRQIELDGLSEANQAILLRIFALEDEAEALAGAAEIATERADLERRILELTGDTAAIRELELAAVDESNRALLLRIFALEDEAAATATAARAADEAARATEQLANLMADVDRAILRSVSPTRAALADLNDQFVDMMTQAISLGASESELMRIRDLHQRSLQKFISDLQISILTLADELFGVEDTFTDIGTAISDATSNIRDSVIRSLEKIDEWLDRSLLGNFSPLTPTERLGEAQQQFEAAFAAAMAGDWSALDRLPALADALLSEGSGFFGTSTAQYRELFDMVRAMMEQAAGLTPPAEMQPPTFGQVEEIRTDASAFRIRLDELEKMQKAWALGEQIGELARLTDDLPADLARGLGFTDTNMRSLLEMLGVDVGTATGAELDGHFNDMIFGIGESNRLLDGIERLIDTLNRIFGDFVTEWKESGSIGPVQPDPIGPIAAASASFASQSYISPAISSGNDQSTILERIDGRLRNLEKISGTGFAVVADEERKTRQTMARPTATARV